MPSGYTIYRIDGAGLPVITDLDSIFEPRQAGDPTANATGFVTGDTGLDLNQRYLPITEGDAYSDNVDFKTPIGSDLRDVFAAIGTASAVTYDGVSSSQHASIAANQVGEQIVALANIQFNTNGTTTQTEGSSRDGIGTPDNNLINGSWFKDAPEVGIGSDYEISIDASDLQIREGINPNISSVSISNSSPAPTYTALSTAAFFLISCETVGGGGGNEVFVNGTVVFNIRKIGTSKVYTKSIVYNVAVIPI